MKAVSIETVLPLEAQTPSKSITFGAWNSEILMALTNVLCRELISA